MPYCSRCGNKNEEDAKFCNDCGSPLTGHPREYRKRRHSEDKWDDRCDEECSGKHKTSLWSNFWIVILTLVAVGIILSILTRFFSDDMPHWMGRGDYWEIFGLLVGLVIIAFIIYAITTSHKKE
jgi:uncharacterized membrane protein YvbJ